MYHVVEAVAESSTDLMSRTAQPGEVKPVTVV